MAGAVPVVVVVGAVVLLVGLGVDAAVYHAGDGPWTDATTWDEKEAPCSEDTVIVQARTQDTVVEIPGAQTRVVSGLALKPTTRIAFPPNAILAFKPSQAHEVGEAVTGSGGSGATEVPCAPLQEVKVEALTSTVALVRWTAAASTVAAVTVSFEVAGRAPVMMNHTELDVHQMHIPGLQEATTYSVHISVQRQGDAMRQVPVLTTAISMPYSVERASPPSSDEWNEPTAWRYSAASDKSPRDLNRNPCDEHVDLDKDVVVSGIQRIESLTLGGPNARIALAPDARIFFTFPVPPEEETLERCTESMTTTTTTTTSTPTATTSAPKVSFSHSTSDFTGGSSSSTRNDGSSPQVSSSPFTPRTSATPVAPGEDAHVHLVLHISQQPSRVNRRQLVLALGAALNAHLNTHIFATDGRVAITTVLAASTGNSTALLDITVPGTLRSETICVIPRLFAPFSASSPVASIYTNRPSVTLALVSLTRCLTCNCPTAGRPTCPAGSVLHINGECLSRPLCSSSDSDCNCPGGGTLEQVNGTWMCMVETVCSSGTGQYVPELGVCVTGGEEASTSSSSADPSIAVGASVGALALVIIVAFIVWYRRSGRSHDKTKLGSWPVHAAHGGMDQRSLGSSLSQSQLLGTGVQRMNPMWQGQAPPPGAIAETAEKEEAEDIDGFDTYLTPTQGTDSADQEEEQAFTMTQEERASYDKPNRRGAAAAQHPQNAPPLPARCPTMQGNSQAPSDGRRPTQRSRPQRAFESPVYGTGSIASASRAGVSKQSSGHYDNPYQPPQKQQPVYMSMDPPESSPARAGYGTVHAHGSAQDNGERQEELVYDVAENSDTPPALPPPRSTYNALSTRARMTLQARGDDDQQA